MAKLVFGMMQSLDGYVQIAGPGDGPGVPPPGPLLGSYFTDSVRGLAGLLYGRRMYEIMQYWDEDQPEWDDGDHAFARLYRSIRKWVASRTLQTVGPNATLIQGDLLAYVRKLKAEVEGEIDVGGPELAAALTPLIDEYRLYYRPIVLGGGKPFFAAGRPPLQIVSADRIGEDAVRVICTPA